MKTLFYKYSHLLALMVYGMSLMAIAKSYPINAPSMNMDDVFIEACDISGSQSSALSTEPSDDNEDQSSKEKELCAGGCKYLPSFSFSCLTHEIIIPSFFHWGFHYQSPYGDTLGDPPRAQIC